MFWKPEDVQKLGALWGEAAASTARAAGTLWGPPAGLGLTERFEAMLGDYRKELHGLPDDAFAVDLAPLLSSLSRVALGQGSEIDQKVVARFTQAMLHKARLGGEYYVDPAQARAEGRPRALVGEAPWMRLFRYEAPAAGRVPGAPPVLVIYSFINQPYILDLSPASTVIGHLLDQGLDVFLIEWGAVAPWGQETSLSQILCEGLPHCVEVVKGLSGAAQVNLLGHCIGGTVAAWYAALRPDDVARVLLFTAPFAAPDVGVLRHWTDPEVFPVDSIVATHGLMPAKLIRHTFMQFKPWVEVMKWRMFVENLANDAVMERFALLDGWANDNRDIPSDVFAPFIHEVYQSRRARDGLSVFGGQAADWRRLTAPVCHIAGGGDWIVPAGSAHPWGEHEGPPNLVRLEAPGGHLGIVIDARARPMWTAMTTFLRGD